ncbi:hypothetical protein BHE74_00034228 [Ensete ventricosum]|nr:hypothetical protein BHE74_00034228 [Ensete ventricosum]
MARSPAPAARTSRAVEDGPGRRWDRRRRRKESRMEVEDEKVLLRSNVTPPDIWAEIVEPSKPAALSCSLQTISLNEDNTDRLVEVRTCTTSEGIPSALAMLGDVFDEHEVFFRSPRPSSELF